MTKPIIIVGASMGGLRVAESLRRFGYGGAITVIGEEPYLPYNRPPLSKVVLATGGGHQDVAFPHRAEIADVQWVLGRRVVAADLQAQVVEDQTGATYPYNALVIATGLRPKRVPGTKDAVRGSALRTLDDAMDLREALQPGARVVIAGSGFIGCEVAATARTLGCEVTVVGGSRFPMEQPLGAALSEELMRRHEEHGVDFRMSARVVEVLGDARVSAARLHDGTTFPCDVLVEAVGSLPNTEWLRGGDIDITNGVLTDSAMRALRSDGQPWPNVFAVGDVARFPNAIYPEAPFTVEHWNIPTETAKRAGKVLALQLRRDETLRTVLEERFAPVPSFWTDQYDIHLLAYGMPNLADRVELLHGRLDGDCVFGYFRSEKMVAVCGIGLRSIMLKYREALAAPGWAPLEGRP